MDQLRDRMAMAMNGDIDNGGRDKEESSISEEYELVNDQLHRECDDDDVLHELPTKNIQHKRPIDFDFFPVLTAGQDEVQFPKHPTKPRKSRKNRNRNRNRNKNKKKSTRKQRTGKQAANDDEN